MHASLDTVCPIIGDTQQHVKHVNVSMCFILYHREQAVSNEP